MWRNLRILILGSVFVSIAMDYDSVGVPHWGMSLGMSLVVFCVVWILTVFCGATSLAFKANKANLTLPKFDSSPFDPNVVWQFEHFARYFFLIGSLAQLVSRDFMAALADSFIGFSVSAGFHFSYVFLRRVNAKLFTAQ